MRKIFIILTLFTIPLFAPKSTNAGVSADSLYVINKNDSSITFVGVYSSTGVVNSVIYRVADSINYFTYGPYNFFGGSFVDTITAVGLMPNMPYSITMYVSDFSSVDSLVILDTTLSNPPDSASVSNLQITNILQTGGTISADYDAGGLLMFLQFWYSMDSINWNLWNVHALYGLGTQTFFYAQTPGTTTYWLAIGANSLNSVLDSSNVGVLVTLGANASPPNLNGIVVSNITQNSAQVDFDLTIDSIILTIVTVQSSLDSSFNTGVWTDSSFVQSSGTMHYSVSIFGNIGYPQGQDVYVRVCAYNISGTDTLFISFQTIPIQTYPPYAVLDPYSVITPTSVNMSCQYDLGGTSIGYIGFEVAYANDTNVIYWNSGIDTLYQNTGSFIRTVSGLYNNTSYVGRAFVFNSNGIYYTPFVNFTTPGFLNIADYTHHKEGPYLVEVFSLDGKLLFSKIIEENIELRSLLPSGFYIIREKSNGKEFFKKVVLQ